MDSVQLTLYAALFLLSGGFLLTVLARNRRRTSLPPGPLALPIIGHLHLLGPRLHQTFHDLSKRYGPLYRLRLGSISYVVVSSPEVARECLKTNELVFSSRDHTTAIDTVTQGSSFAFSPYGPYWKFIKKLCTYELLGARNLNHFLPVRDFEVKSFLEILMKKGKSGEAFNVTEELLNLTNNMISHTMLSIRHSESEGDAAAARTVIRDVTQIFGELNASDILWFCKNFDLQGIRKRSEDIQRRYDALLEKIICDREELRRSSGGGGEARDFLDMLLDVMESGKSEVKFTREHLKALVLDFFNAGTDTTALTVEWAIAELVNNPNVLKQAQEEIDKVIGSDRLVQESDAPNLPYLQAVLKETFRLHPPIPMLNRKSVSDCVIDGYKIPAASILFVNNWSIGRNPKYWESPMLFRPERFLEKENCSIDIKGQHFELLPFGTGRRGCPGMLLAIQELISILGTLIQCFDWKLPDGSMSVDMSERPGLTAPRAHDLFCRVVPRVDPVVVSGP
ncbi:Cytochrome P450 CYP2 subfamily [Handroanthus impetiginosus]|uniref:Cytochrome P450 CYP2 subfamily n=1 Tax=Handroanthus impetiginosus TaxID=429701 RepID=A0A2G9I2W9_9LAMI|nr:Cytochrome P450 CYP2 subfamily [Handroanthus impetiginosus]